MSGAVITEEHAAVTDEETLRERIGRGSLPLAEALQDAIQIATCLRDLHEQGLMYGGVSSHAILLGGQGAYLRPGGGAQLADKHDDVAAFGGVLREILWGTGEAESQEEVEALAARCQEDTFDMQHVAIRLRILALRIRHNGLAAPCPVAVQRPQAIQKKHKVRLRIHLSLHWKPLANLAAFTLPAK